MISIPSFRSFLTLAEGVDDPGILKCVFMAGGPGSGKSYAVSALFGVDAKIQSSVSTYGLKVVNSDRAFETLLRQNGIDPRDLGRLSTDPASWEHAMTIRDRAKQLTQTQQRGYEAGRLGLIVDGTGDDVAKMTTKVRHATAHGYDCFLVIVNTSLETALARNRSRERTLSDEMVTQSWQAVQHNLGQLQRVFGAANVLIVDNDEGATAVHEMGAQIRQWLRRPVSNPLGRRWIVAQGGRH